MRGGGGDESIGMKQRLVNVLSALSLLVLVAAVVLWVRSYWVIDRVGFASGQLYRAISGGGGVFLESLRVFRHTRSWRDGTATPVEIAVLDYCDWYADYPDVRSIVAAPRHWETGTYGRASLMKHAWGQDINLALPHMTKLAIARQNVWGGADGTSAHDSLYGPRVWVPYWMIVAVAAPLSVWWIGSRVRQFRRRARGLCAACGYDLRATPGRCPECGEYDRVCSGR